MKALFLGNHFGGNGPQNVNKNIIAYIHSNIDYIRVRNPYLRFFEMIYKILFHKVIIFSAPSKYDHIIIPICCALKKKIIFIMHGYLKYEIELNNYPFNIRGVKNEKLLLSHSDLILCVSSPFKKLMESLLPEYAYKMNVLTNGINWNLLSTEIGYFQKNDKDIVLLGGGRKTKRNLQVCLAFDELNKEYNTGYIVHLYGNDQPCYDLMEIKKISCVRFHGYVSHEEILSQMQKSFLFVQNSDFEPFSLGVIEALCCGCSILISKNVGAKDIISGITSNDIIIDPQNIKEIKEKIIHVVKNQNNTRLLSSINREKTSIEARANELINYVHGIERK